MDRFEEIKSQYRRFPGDTERRDGWGSDVAWLIEHVEQLRMQVGAMANKFSALYGDNWTLEELMKFTPYEKIVHLKALCKRQREQIEGLKLTIPVMIKPVSYVSRVALAKAITEWLDDTKTDDTTKVLLDENEATK